jgi:hypothetical protein
LYRKKFYIYAFTFSEYFDILTLLVIQLMGGSILKGVNQKRSYHAGTIALYSVVAVFLAYIVWQFMLSDLHKTGVTGAKWRLLDFPWNTWIVFLYIHIILGVVALVIGPFQFLEISRRKSARLHRVLGKLYVGAIFINFPIACYLAIYATGGFLSAIAFLILDISWFLTTLIALLQIRKRNIKAHQLWMLRSYAVTWVFVMFRVFVVFLTMAFGLGLGFSLSVYLSLIVNLSFVEWRWRRKNKIKGPDQTIVSSR